MKRAPRDLPILETEAPIRLAVCVSGSGTTLQNLLDRIKAGELRAEVVQVVASKAGIGAIARAESARVPAAVITRSGRTLDGFSNEVFETVRRQAVDLVVLGGFLALIRIPEDYTGRVINIHPSLIPAFCGKGFHGEAVHRAAIERGVKVSGCTVHFCDNEYDAGPIILQRTVPVMDGDTPAALATRVFEAECQALPEAIALFAGGRLAVKNRRVHVFEG